MDENSSIRVLLVENDPADARLIEELLNENRLDAFLIKCVATVQQALQVLIRKGEEIQVILLDLGLPDDSGLQSLRRIMPVADDACVVVITNLQDDELAVASVKEGAQDYVCKASMDGHHLRRAIRYGMERHHMQAELRNLALQDPLTGLHNRHGFLMLAEQQMKISRRNQSPSLLIFFDLDGLKKINDTFGHEAGNRAILEATTLLRSSLRQCDILARVGGDEFVGLILGAPESAETVIRTNLQRRLDEHNSRPERLHPVEFSLGVALCDPRQQIPITDILKRADALMYEEKRRKAGAVGAYR